MTAEEQIAFLRNFQELLSEGGFVATYKFALLQALADLSIEQPETEGADGPLWLSIETLAEKFVEYYWDQVRPFCDDRFLSQCTSREAAIVSRLHAIRGSGKVSLPDFRSHNKEEYCKLITKTSCIIRDDPLQRLQQFGNLTKEFLFNWDEISKTRRIRDWQIRLLPGVPAAFREFHSMLTSMIRGAWIAHIQRIRSNHEILGPQADLECFLFGADRSSLKAFGQVLSEYQRHKCFYCEGPVRDEGEVDHFVPWRRYALDLGHNFVFSHKSCNNAKRDHLAGLRHLERWRQQNLDDPIPLQRSFDERGLIHDVRRTRAVADWAYSQVESAGAQLWIEAGRFESCTPRWHEILKAHQNGGRDGGTPENNQ